MSDNKEKLLELKNITKVFPGVKACDNVSFNVNKGEVHALVGENGAGKSTLMKVMAGIYTPEEGQIIYNGDEVKFTNPLDAKEKGIIFIEDAAQAIGTSLNGKRAGTIGNSSVFSFNTNKVVPGVNGGGVVCTDDEEIACYIKKLKRPGKDGDFSILGYNSRMYVLNAKIIEFRLKNLEKNKQKRQKIARIYNSEFADLPVNTQEQHDGLDHNYHKYVIRFQDKETRKEVKHSLSATIHYEKPLSDNSMYNDIKYRKDDCANAKQASDTVLSLPIHAWLETNEIQTIINAVKQGVVHT